MQSILKTGNPPASGNGAQCGDCHKNFRWFDFETTMILSTIYLIKLIETSGIIPRDAANYLW